MKKLLYYIPHRLYRSAKDVDPITREFVSMFNPWISLSDRTNTLDIPGIPVFNNSPIPSKPDSIPTFSATSYKRIDDCIEKLKQEGKEKLVIFYSGGIDSTLIVALLISHPEWNELKKVTWLAINEDSQIENPDFFDEIVLPMFGTHLLPSNQFYSIIADERNVCVTGECADNLFGSLTLKGYMDNTGTFETAINGDWQNESLPWLLEKRKEFREEREDMLNRLVAASPVPINTNHDFLWWLNFSMKWQAVKYRLAMHSPTAKQAEYMAENVVNFFDSEQYQQWALYTKEPKVSDKWNTYKLPAKKLINDIWENKKYLEYKTKWPSLPGITRYNNAWGFLWQNDNGSLTATKELND